MQHGKDVVEQILRTRAQAFEVTLCDGRQIGMEGRSLVLCPSPVRRHGDIWEHSRYHCSSD